MKDNANIFLIGAVFLLFLNPLIASAAPVHMKVASSSKEVALTFDDGPYGTSTEQILSILEAEGVPATFFVIGKNVEQFPQLAREIVADGESIGNHTYDHTKHLTTMSRVQVDTELAKTESLIASTTGVRTTLFRPPYGSITSALRKQIRAQGYRVVMWNVDPRDWNYASSSSELIVERVLAHLKNHMIILLHDGRDTHVDYPRDNTINALPTLIEDLKQRGYTFVKFDEKSGKQL